MTSIQGNANDPDTYFHPVREGFRGVVVLRPSPMSLDYRLRTWDLAGGLTGDIAMQVRTIAPLPDGGSIAVVWPSAVSANTELAWVDARGTVTRTVPLDNDVYRVIVNWPTGHLFAFVGGLSSRPTQGRWYDGSGTPLTPWFDINNVEKGSGSYQRLLANGVVALGNQGGPWLTAVRDGFNGTEAVPAWLAARPGKRLATIRTGRGFAVLPATGIESFEIVTTDGQSCGTVALPSLPPEAGEISAFPPPRLDVGWDGTVFQSALVQTPGASSPQRCVFRWWPALLL